MSKEKGKKKLQTSYGLQAKELATYAKQFMLPIESDGRPIVSPSNYPSQVCVRHIHKVIDVSSATAAYANGFTVAMYPNLYNPGFISASTAVLVPAVAPSLVSVHGELIVDEGSTTRAVANGALKAVDTIGANSKFVLRDIADSAAVTNSGFSLTPGPVTAFNAEFTNFLSQPCQLSFISKVAGGAWGTTSVILSAYQTRSISGNFALNTDAIAFAWVGGSATKTAVRFSLVMNSSQVTSPVGSTFYPAFSEFIIDNEVSSGRVVSMSVLVTNTSPDIANGGNVNAGRVPHTFSPTNQIASNLASLPSNRRYQGPASTGAYVSWMPSQFDEYEIDTIVEKELALRSAEYLLVEISGWNPPAGSTASARIQFDWIVEFYTPNQLFEKSVCPMLTNDFEALYHLILSMDAATCNPGHLDGLKKILKGGVQMVKKGQKFYGQHEAGINTIISLLSAMLA